MITSKIIAGLQILQKYREKDGWACSAEHDELYAYSPSRPVSEEDFKSLVSLGWCQDTFTNKDDHSYAEYDPSESWYAFV